MKNSKPTVDTVDLTSREEIELEKKRSRTISQIIVQEQSERIVLVKQEKSAAEASLKSATAEKQAVAADLEDVREDLDIANDTVTQQAVATNIWQSRFDELVALVGVGQADGAMISVIRNRSLSSGSSIE